MVNLPQNDSKRLFFRPQRPVRKAAVAALCLLLTRAALAQMATATIATGTNPCFVVVNSVTNKIYVANSGSNSVTVIDGGTHGIANVSVGDFPDTLAVNPVTNKIYVANRLSATVTVIDGPTNGATTITVGSLPQAIAVNQATDKIYVANYGDKTVTVIDGATNTTATIPVGSNPQSVAVNPVTNKIYVANYGSADVTVIDGATNDASRVAVGKGPSSAAVNSVTNKIYVANSLDANVTVIDGATNNTITAVAGTTPDSVAVDAVANKIYVANKGSNSLTVIDGATSQTSTVMVGTTPLSVAVNSTTGKIYVATSSGGNVTIVDLSTGAGATLTTAVTAATSPASIAVNPVTGQIYATNFIADSVTVLNTDTAASTDAPATAKISQAITQPVTPAPPSFTLSTTSAAANAEPATYFAYGDSITYGSGASSTATRYASRIAADLSAVLTDRGVGGAQACDTAQVIMSNDNPPASQAPLQTIEVGTNDGFKKGTGAYEAVYQSCHTASLAWLAIPSSQKTVAQSCTQTGTWEPDTTYAAGVAAKSNSPGATLSCGVTSYGGPIYLWYRVTDGNIGAFQYSLDGGPQSLPLNSFSTPAVATWNGGADGVFLVRMAGVAAGSHTVKITVNRSVVSILAVGSLNPVAQAGAPEVFAGGVIRYQYDASPTVSAAYNADAQADVTLLSGDGLPVYFVPVRNFVNANSDMFDGFHPNDTGHLHLRDAYESLGQFPLNSPAAFSSSVTVTPANGFNSAVTLAASGWPAGITGKFGTNPTGTSSAVNIGVAPTVAPGTYTLAVAGISGNLSAATSIPITVAATPSFTLSATATTATAALPGTSTVSVTPLNGFQSVVEFTPSGWPAGITATFAPNPTGSSSTVTISVTASVAPGVYNLTLVGSLGTLSASTTFALKVSAVSGLTSSAIFTQTDTMTQGNWSGTYGGDGYLIAGGVNNLPGYAAVASKGASTYVWTTSTTDVRALQTSGGSANRIAGCFYPPSNGTQYSASASTFSFGVFFSDNATHQVAMYLLDWDSTVRSQTIVITDNLTGTILDSRSFSQFNGGAYAVWNIRGNVTINVTATALGGAVASALLFGPTAPAPVISAVSVSSITSTSAAISWTSSMAATTQVNYGTTSAYGSSSPLNSSLAQSHSVTLTGLTPGTTYNYDVISSNSTGIAGMSANYTFATVLSAPVISGLSVSGITSTSATVSWTTDQASTTQVNYGTTSAYGSSSPLNSSLVQSHSVTLTGLTPGTTYAFDVVSKATAGFSTTSTNYTFITPAAIPVPPNVGYVGFWGITNSGVTISWSTDVPATTQLAYGTTPALGQLIPGQVAQTTAHGVVLSGLSPGTKYYFVAQSTGANGATGYSTSYSFTTTGASSSSSSPKGSAPAPVISSVAASTVTSATAIITWTTDQASSSQVNYGTTTSYGLSSTLDSTLVTNHLVTLTGLAPNTTYNFDVVSANSAYTSSNSNNATFTTSSVPGASPAVSYLAFWGITNSGIAISWSTNVAATTVVAYGTSGALGQMSPLQTSLTYSHGVVLTGLAASTTYYFVARSTDVKGNTGYSATYSFTTAAGPPSISAASLTPTANKTAVISWVTSAPTYSYVQYGSAAGIYNRFTSETSLTTAPQVTLTYVPSGVVHYQLVSTDVNGNKAVSQDSTFVEP